MNLTQIPHEQELLKEDPKIPFPIQRFDWMANIQSPFFHHIFSKLKKDYPNGELCPIWRMAEYTEEEYSDLIANMQYQNMMDTWSAIEIQMVYNLTFMYNWSLFKQSYRYDDDFFQMLMYETDGKEVPVSILKSRLPFPAFFIDNRFTDADGCQYRGVYVSLIMDRPECPELGMFFVEDTGESDYKYCLIPLYYGDKNIDELREMRNQEFFQTPKVHDDVNPDTMDQMVKGVINAVLYLCADNKEVTVKKVKTDQTVKSGPAKNKKKTVKSTSNEVGYRIGSVIRKTKTIYVHEEEQETSSESSVKHKKKTPHIRRAHLHHYWTGSKKNPEERKLINVFLPPQYIGKYLEEEENQKKATLHKVKK